MPQVSVSEYWHDWLKHIVETGIRQSKRVVVQEALARHRRLVESEAEEFLQLKAEQKERRDLKHDNV